MDDVDSMGIFNRISASMPEFTNSERKVARFILSEKQSITNMTILDIAQGADVSEASVMRFCSKLGIRKLIDLRIQIAKDSDKSQPDSDNPLGQQENDYIDVIRNTSSLINEEKIDESIRMIENCSALYFLGIAASGIAAVTGADSFMRLGINSHVLTEGHYQLMQASLMGPGNVVIALSLSGNTKDICEACQVAKEAGAGIIAVTSYAKSQLARIADITLLTSAKEDIIDGGKITGCLSQLYIIDALKRGYQSRHSAYASEMKEKLAKSIIVKKY